jgi:membrane protein
VTEHDSPSPGGIPALVNGVRDWADAVQRRHTVFGFPYAVVKKYGDDEGGRHAALLTYYGFLSLFPFLLLVVWVLGQVLRDDATRARFIDAIVPDQFADTVDSAVKALPSSGLPLVIGVVGLLFSGLGIVFSAYQTLNHVATVPHRARLEFVPRYLRIVAMLLLLVVGALGVGALTVASSTLVDIPGLSRLAASVGTAVLTFLLLWAATALLLPHRAHLHIVWPAALTGAVTVTVVITFGASLLTSLVQRSGAVYGSFATIVGFFALLYVVSQLLVYAAEVAIVRRRRLWPRALDTAHPTDADRRALLLLAREQERIPSQRIQATFTPGAGPGTPES